MSLKSMCRSETGTIKRKDTSRSASMGRQANYTTAARGTLPTTIVFRRNLSGPSRRFEYGRHEETHDATLYTTTNPQCDERDLVEVTNADTNELLQFFVQAQTDPDQMRKFWALHCKVVRGNIQ